MRVPLLNLSLGSLMTGLGVMPKILIWSMMPLLSFLWLQGPLQTLQRAEYWEAILALQAFSCLRIWVWIIKMFVTTLVGCSLVGAGSPFFFCTDGDLLICFYDMVQYRTMHVGQS